MLDVDRLISVPSSFGNIDNKRLSITVIKFHFLSEFLWNFEHKCNHDIVILS